MRERRKIGLKTRGFRKNSNISDLLNSNNRGEEQIHVSASRSDVVNECVTIKGDENFTGSSVSAFKPAQLRSKKSLLCFQKSWGGDLIIILSGRKKTVMIK